MAKLILKDPSITINAVDLSDHISSVEIEDEADEVELTSFGSGYREFGQGLKDATITLEVFQDFDAASVDATLQPLYAAGDSFPVAIRPSADAIGATNPEYSMTGQLFSYSPIAGEVGEASTTSVTIRNASSSVGLTRAIA